MNEEKNKGGRPLAEFDLPEGWQDTFLELYEEGASDTEIKGQIWKWRRSFSDDLWKRWMTDNEEFSGTIKQGRALSATWWEHQGRTNLNKQGYSYTGWYMNMKNRFRWKDKTEIDNTSSDGSMKPKEKTVIVFNKK